jgi:HlyD family secretion protein/macrolide-specific efflux system membrane fusion protein
MKKVLVLLMVGVVLAGGGWYVFGRSDTNTKPEVLGTAAIEKRTVRKVLEATGIIKAQVGAQVKIGARASGVIEQMLVKIGDQVHKGQLIAVIDSRDAEAKVAQAEAALRRQESELAKVRVVYPLRIKEAEALYDLAKVKQEYEDKNYTRKKQLVDRKLAAVDDADQAYQNAMVARNDVLAKKATLVRTEQEFKKELGSRRRAVAEARAQLELNRIQYSYTRIRSPIDGTVSQVTAQEGETLVSGLQVSNLITVLDPLRLEMWIYVDETDVGQVRLGMPVEFTVDSYADKVFRGTLDRIYPEPEIRDNIVYYQAIVKLNREQARQLRPEMTTQCRIVVREKVDALAMPNAALKWVDGRMVVFRVGADDAATRLEPKLGLEGMRYTEVLSGLAAGDKVATKIILPETGEGKGKANRGGKQP